MAGRRRSWNLGPVKGMRTALRAVVVVLFLAPVAFMVLGSLRGLDLPPLTGLDLVPDEPGAAAFRRLPEVLPLGRLVLNSLIVVGLAVPITVVVSTWAGFGMAVLGERSRRILVGVTVGLLVLPLPTLWVARFVLYRWFGVLDSLVPLVAPAFAATSPFTVLLAYRAFRRVPPDLWAAARLEGSSSLRTWWSVGLPLVRPTTAAIAALAFTVHWGNYLDALLYLRSPEHQTLAVGIAELKDLDPSDAPLALAGALLLTAVPLVLLALVQRRLFAAVDR
jgi:multiple sugar transport system permease protein